MTSSTKKDLEYINSFYEKKDKIQVLGIDEQERLCVISVSVFDGQEDVVNPIKTIEIPIDFTYEENLENDEEYEIFLFNVPKMLSDFDTEIIVEAIREHFHKEKLYCIKWLSDGEITITDKFQIGAIQHRDSKERSRSICILGEAKEEDFKKYEVSISCDRKYYNIPDFVKTNKD